MGNRHRSGLTHPPGHPPRSLRLGSVEQGSYDDFKRADPEFSCIRGTNGYDGAVVSNNTVDVPRTQPTVLYILRGRRRHRRGDELSGFEERGRDRCYGQLNSAGCRCKHEEGWVYALWDHALRFHVGWPLPPPPNN